MKKKVLSFFTGLLLILGVVHIGYAAIAMDWFFDFEPGDVNAGMVVVAHYFDVATPNTVNLTIDNNGDDFTFVNKGSFSIVQKDGEFLPFLYMGLVTGRYIWNGEGSLSNETVNFTDGNLELFFGGIQIAELALTSGVGAIDQSGAPVNNETFTIHYESNWLTPGYFYYSDGTDMATTGIKGFTTTNAVVLPVNDGSNDFNLASNGQFFVETVPVPSAILLFGCGILGLVGLVRKDS